MATNGKRCEDRIGRMVFEALAEDENRHKDAIEAYYAAARKKTRLPVLSSVMPAHKNIKKRVIFGKLEKDLFKGEAKETTSLEAYEIQYYIGNPASWFITEEKPVVEG